MPFLGLGQSNFYNKILGDRNLTPEIGFEKHLETTLINDIRYHKSVLNFDLDTSYDLSFAIKNDQPFKFIDGYKLDEILLETGPVKDFKWQFRKPIETKILFEN